MWLEMSRDEEHGGTGWRFTECLWSPSHKNPRGHWSFWQLLLSVRKGDIVVHLRGKTHHAAFIGYSIADADGYETTDRPTEPKDWGYANSYYRVPLTGFVPFVNPISLDAILAQENDRLKAFFQVNKSRPKAQREHIFYVFQSNRLQCLNGAYLSEMGQEHLPEFSWVPISQDPRLNLAPLRSPLQLASRLRQLPRELDKERFQTTSARTMGISAAFLNAA